MELQNMSSPKENPEDIFITFWEYILETTDPEPIESIVIGEYGWYSEESPNDTIPTERRYKLLSPEEARFYLSYDHDPGYASADAPPRGGYGSPGCHAVTIWTPQNIFFVVQYDGSTRLDKVPRHPVEHYTTMFGQ